ncbi:MIP/aquaporin family protein [Allocoleopsis sp.]|uniref:MIP/aquaporin family protein n=1 Tax=Allocoleopsis sp. TaxID=3088169 RepID=UPI002FD4F445
MSNGKQTKNFQSKANQRTEEWRRLFAELFGTFMLTLVAAGADVIEAATHHELGHAAKVVAPGLLVMAMIYTVGEISGAHFNPAVTLAFAIRQDFPWRQVPRYWLAQLLGAVLAAIFLRSLFGNVGHLGATLPDAKQGVIPALAIEIVLTCLLVSVILGTAKQHRLVGHNAAIAVGGTIALCGLFASPISGASMNPARSLAPDLVAGTLGSTWIYLVGPIAGALLAAAIAWNLHGNPSHSEVKAAKGDRSEQMQD